MQTERIEVSTFLNAPPEQVYRAWLDGRQHSDFTGARATIDPKVGGGFTVWDDYVRGRTLELERPRRIVQEWRASDFPEGAAPSRIEVRFEAEKDGTRLSILHSELPDGTGKGFAKGWKDFYFTPMRQYFDALSKGTAKARKGKAGLPGKGLRGDAAHRAPVKKAKSKQAAPKKRATARTASRR